MRLDFTLKLGFMDVRMLQQRPSGVTSSLIIMLQSIESNSSYS